MIVACITRSLKMILLYICCCMWMTCLLMLKICLKLFGWRSIYVRSLSMKDLGASKKILGMKINWDRRIVKLILSQSSYIGKVLKRFNMTCAKLCCSFVFQFQFVCRHVTKNKRWNRYPVFHNPVQLVASYMLWIALVLTFHMLLVLWIDTWHVLVKNIGRQWSGSWDTWKVLRMWAWIFPKIS